MKIWLLAVLSGMAWLICGCASNHTLTLQQATWPEEKVDARGIFAENCATCHGLDGRAKTFHGRLVGAQNFTDPKWQVTITEPEIARAIRTGPEAMPAFEKKLSQSEIAALAAYVTTFKPAQ